MSLHRFFLDGPLAPEHGSGDAFKLPLAPSDLHHAVSVLRVRAGEEIEVVSPDGVLHRVRCTSADPAHLYAIHLEASEPAIGAHPRIILLQGLPKGDKMDVIVRMTVEIGVDAIHPVITTRSEVRLSTERRRAKVERWRRIARSAAEQSHRQRVPELGEPAPLADVIKALGPTAHIITLSEREKGATLRHVLNDLETPSSSLDVALVVGPEGGLSVEEEYALSDAGALTATLGETILRTETAAVVAVALANDIRGGTD